LISIKPGQKKSGIDPRPMKIEHRRDRLKRSI
jgi:hypothetical protein